MSDLVHYMCHILTIMSFHQEQWLTTVPVFFLFYFSEKELGYVNANSAKDQTFFQMSLSLETRTRASCLSRLRISVARCVCFLFCSPPQRCTSFGDFAQRELWVSHLHFLSYCVDRTRSVKGKKNQFEENSFERLMEVLFSVISLPFLMFMTFIVKGQV